MSTPEQDKLRNLSAAASRPLDVQLTGEPAEVARSLVRDLAEVDDAKDVIITGLSLLKLAKNKTIQIHDDDGKYQELYLWKQ